MKIGRYILLTLLLLSLLASCGGRDADRVELERIDSLASNREPRRALELLDSIDSQSLSESNRNLYELMRIKARDKDFQVHRSNATILRLVGYYRNHPSEGRYPEALYYAGRVHYDIGDFPSALNFYQFALEEYKNIDSSSEMQSKLMYHIGHLLNMLRLYDESAKYLKESSEFYISRKDTTAYLMCLEILAAIYLHKEDFAKSDSIINTGLKILDIIKVNPFTRQERGTLLMYRAGAKFKQHATTEALKLIRESQHYIDSMGYPTWLGYASDIYLQANIKDTALLYAKKLAYIESSKNCKHGFQNILSPELIQQISHDSLINYILRYTDVMEEFVDRNADEAALLQHSAYNYNLIDAHNKKTEESLLYYKLACWVLIGLLFAILTFIITYYCKKRQSKGHKQEHKLEYEDKDNYDVLSKVKTECNNNHHPDMAKHKGETIILETQNIGTESQQLLRDKLISVVSNKTILNAPRIIPESIKYSNIYKRMKDYAKNDKCIPSKHDDWKELEEVVTGQWPQFKKNFDILTGRTHNPEDYHLALLIKCGFLPKHCAPLFAVKSSGMTHRRDRLRKAMFGTRDVKPIDNIIYLL